MKAVHQPGGEHRVSTDIAVSICETRPYPVPKVGLQKGFIDVVLLVDAGSVLTRKHWTDTSDAPSCAQSGGGSSSVLSPLGEIRRVLEEVGLNGELEWSAPVYHVELAPSVSFSWNQVCQVDTGTQSHTYEEGVGGWSVNSGPARELPLEGGRMTGAYRDGPVDWVSWSICREGVPCSPPPSPDEGGGAAPAASCSEGPQLALARLCREQMARKLDQHLPIWREYTRLQQAADQMWPSFKWAAAQCAAWKAAEFALTTVLGGEAEALGDVGANAERARQVLEAMISGDYGGLVLDVDSFEERDEFKYGLANAKKVLDGLDKAGSVAHLLSSNLIGIQGAAMDSCLGAVTPELHMKALAYIELTKQAATYHAEHVATNLNDIRSKSLECLDKDAAAWRACREASECRGEALEGCGPDPHEIYDQP